MTHAMTVNGTVLTENELMYRKLLIEDAKLICPVSRKLLSIYEGEILFVKNIDYFISNEGIEKLKSIFGNESILGRIITYD